MDNEQFLKRLTELAEWEYPKIGPNGCESVVKKRGRKSQEEQEWEANEEEMIGEEVVVSDNDTLPPRITKLKPHVELCPDCGETVLDRTVAIKKCYTNKPHWRQQCVTCKKHRDPRTGEFCLTGVEAQLAWQAYNRGNGIYNSKHQTNKDTNTKDIV